MRAAKVASQLRSAKAEAGPDAIRDELSAARARSSSHAFVLRIVSVNDRKRRGAQALEQLLLRLGVALEVAVIVQVIARQVREDRGMEGHTRGALLLQRMRAHFHRHAITTQVAMARQQTLQRRRIRSRVRRRLKHTISQAMARSAQHRCTLAGLVEQLPREVRDRGLAIGAGDTNQLHVARRLAVHERSGTSCHLTRLRVHPHRHAQDHIQCARRQNGGCAALDRIVHIARAVELRARHGAEQVTRHHGAAVQLHAGDHGTGARQARQQRSTQLRYEFSETHAHPPPTGDRELLHASDDDPPPWDRRH